MKTVRSSFQKGFTLIEILLSLTLIGLASTAIMMGIERLAKQKKSLVLIVDRDMLVKKIQTFLADEFDCKGMLQGTEVNGGSSITLKNPDDGSVFLSQGQRVGNQFLTNSILLESVSTIEHLSSDGLKQKHLLSLKLSGQESGQSSGTPPKEAVFYFLGVLEQTSAGAPFLLNRCMMSDSEEQRCIELGGTWNANTDPACSLSLPTCTALGLIEDSVSKQCIPDPAFFRACDSQTEAFTGYEINPSNLKLQAKCVKIAPLFLNATCPKFLRGFNSDGTAVCQ